MVLCKVTECYYCSDNGFCKSNFLKITPQGLCGRIYDNNGQVKADWNTLPQQQEKTEIEGEKN